MASDQATLLNLAHCFRCVGVHGAAQLLKLGLMVQIVNNLNPMQATDPATLLTQPNVACYRSCSNASVGDLLELALLQLIVQNASGGGTSGTGSPAAATLGTFYFKTSDSTIWANNNGTWEQIV